ncbi:restriction endonuclease [Bacillus sp. JJ664]
MNKEIIYQSLVISLLIFIVVKGMLLYRKYRLVIGKLKNAKPVIKQIDSLQFYKGDHFTIKDVRDSEIKRIRTELEEEYGFDNIKISYVKVALNEIINELRINVEANKRTKLIKENISIEQIDLMTGIEFEHFLKSLFDKRGFKSVVTPGSGDQGVDLILYKDGRKIAIQAKRYSVTNNVGNKAIQEVNTGMQFYECNEAYVITTSDYTRSAVQLAMKVEVKLVNRNNLVALLNNKYDM